MKWDEALELTAEVLPSVISFVETLFSKKPKSGAEKKAAVHSMIKLGFEEAGKHFTGGAHNTVEKLNKVLPQMIDDTVDEVINK